MKKLSIVTILLALPSVTLAMEKYPVLRYSKNEVNLHITGYVSGQPVSTKECLHLTPGTPCDGGTHGGIDVQFMLHDSTPWEYWLRAMIWIKNNNGVFALQSEELAGKRNDVADRLLKWDFSSEGEHEVWVEVTEISEHCVDTYTETTQQGES
jgi:hypothetical protein